MKGNNDYWNHNVAYHKWILSLIRQKDIVLDVGCGEGLLVSKLAAKCRQVIGIDTHLESIKTAQDRIQNIDNAACFSVSLADYQSDTLVDVIIFVASIHHMDMRKALLKAKSLLSPHGKIVIVGCARPEGIVDHLVEIGRVIPAKIGSILHGEKNGGEVGVPIAKPDLSVKQIRSLAEELLPGAKMHKGLYYRYLLLWKK